MDRSTSQDPSFTQKAAAARLPRLLGKLLPVVAGGLALGVTGASGCGDTVDSRGEVEAASERGSLGEARQADSTPITCVTLRRGLTKAFDTMVSSEKAANNYGASTLALVGQASGGVDHFYSLFKFDLSTIPANATITSANVGLSQIAPAPGTWNVHLITAPWDEATVTWQSFGGAFSPQILKSPSTATASVVFSIIPQLQAWVSGAAPNHGLLIERPGASQAKIKTQEYVVPNDRPFLAACYKVTCAPSHADCNGVAADGCEADLLSAATCGSCGTPCAPPHATGACGNGVCAIGSCDLGYADCDSDPQNGCETSLTTATDCGACGVACALPGGAATCASGSCKLVSCDAGRYDCDGDPQNGCEPVPCDVGAHCAGSSGCTSQICAGGFCSSPACNDHVQNGSETGLDCGGTCPSCPSGGGCQGDADCQSLVCNGGSCAAPSCNDGVKNGGESAPDCGGGCAPCAEGLPCANGGDCQSGVCLGGACHAPACGDGVKNGSETGLDCGGSCAPCPSGSGCLAGADCANGVCAGQVCQMPSCADGIKNGAETDVDCGGGCPVCNDNAVCTGNADCANGVCANGHCHPASCTDGVKNGDETGVDCGGACAVPEVCNGVDDDCDGSVDEGLGTTTCGVGACQVTVQSCVNGVAQSCVPGAPAPQEICDGALDDDCDGVVDDGCECVNGATQGCYTGAAATQNVGACHGGTQTCALGHWGACAGQITPGVEACDGVDNDCDGQTDEDLGSAICGVGACQVMVQNCVNGVAQSCVPGAPSAETCDGKDNDCNGQVDDGLPVLSCGAGVCATTVSSCVNGVPQVCNVHAKDGVACNDGHDCTGSDACQAGVCAGSALPAGTTCRASTGACDPAETCNGAALDCPANALASAATVCRAAVNECDVQETCTGSSAACPADAVKSAATACSSDAISCTADFCNGNAAAPACVHTPSLGCQGNPGTSCLNILNGGGSVGSGVYYIDPDGGGPIAPFQAYCEMTADGGGWTLAMRVQSANSAFRDFYSSYWTDAVLLNSVSNIDPTVDADAKYASFTGVAGTSIRGCLRNTSTGVFGCKFYSYGASKTLRALFTDTPIGSDAAGKGLFFNEPTPSTWLTMWGHNTGQLSTANCYERVGLNVDDDQSCYHARVRFGYMANNECNIVTLNDTAGFGASAYGPNVCDGLESPWRVGAGLQANSTTYGTIGGIWVR